MASVTVARVSEPTYLAAVRESYDTVSDVYAERFPVTAIDPLGRAMLGAFAEMVREADRGPVADLGCGPGHVTAHLAELGLPVFGVDVSPKMVEQARQTHPGLRFEVGSMTSLDLADDGLGGILAFWSTFHTPPEYLPVIFAEFHRTLAPGGRLLLGGYVGDNVHTSPTQAYGGRPVSYGVHLLPPDHIAELLAKAGLTVTAQLVQEGEKRQSGYFLAEKPVR